MSATMELSPEVLETIGSYVRRNLKSWFEETVEQSYAHRDIELRERAIRTEEELKTQRELMLRGFEQVDTRFELIERSFEQVDKRFEQVDKRFDEVDKRFELIDKRFDQVDKRFEQVDSRFAEQRADVNTRFEELHSHMNRWMTLFTIVAGLIGLALTVVNIIIR